MAKISIVGAGWLGLPLGAELVREGHEVTGTTTREDNIARLKEKGLKAKIFRSGEATEADFDEVAECDILLVTAPPRGSEKDYGSFLGRLSLAAKNKGAGQLIYTSATSVYPDKNAVVTEKDAEMIVSPHSGIRLLAMENTIREHFGAEANTVRLGGLFGPGRDPARWMSGRQNASGADSPVNMIHLVDCIGAITALINAKTQGQTYNAVAPIHPTRRDFYALACAASGLQPPQWNSHAKPWKKVSAEKLITELKYSFTYPDPSLSF